MSALRSHLPVPHERLLPNTTTGSASPEKTSGALAVVAGLIAAVKLARVESREIQRGSPRVSSAISDSVTIARMVIEAAKVVLGN